VMQVPLALIVAASLRWGELASTLSGGAGGVCNLPVPQPCSAGAPNR